MVTSDRDTLPPGPPDADAAEFEREVRMRGEASARAARLFALALVIGLVVVGADHDATFRPEGT